jgi:hypothetical protein
MYICLNCGFVFERPGKWLQKHGLQTPPYEMLLCCPICGGDFDLAQDCAVCGKKAAQDLCEDGLCPDCMRAAEEKFCRFMDRFSAAERLYLNHRFDGSWF